MKLGQWSDDAREVIARRREELAKMTPASDDVATIAFNAMEDVMPRTAEEVGHAIVDDPSLLDESGAAGTPAWQVLVGVWRDEIADHVVAYADDLAEGAADFVGHAVATGRLHGRHVARCACGWKIDGDSLDWMATQIGRHIVETSG